MTELRNIAILGSTGSIGTQTLDILSEYPTLFRPWLLVANTSAELLIEQARKHLPRRVIIADESRYAMVRDALAALPEIEVMTGNQAVVDAVTDPAIDTVVTVVAGELIDSMLATSQSVLYPVDSEHGAFYQCLQGERHDDVEKLILTASGGPFRTTPLHELEKVTAADALKHPNWSMGAKITIDSATMMNKGFEMIEAQWLYHIAPRDIEIVVHPQSIVHSMVQFVDGSVKAQLGLPDMHLPIRYALGLPDRRLRTDTGKMMLSDYASLTFEAPDRKKFPLLDTAYRAAERGGNAPCVMNAANEIAVAAFLQNKIAFTDIYNVIEDTLAKVAWIERPGYDDYVATNDEARALTAELINIKQKRH